MTSARPLVSVIVPYHSHGRHLHRAIFSAICSYAGPIEIIVVNDGSVETRAETYLEDLRSIDPEIRIIHRENGGLSSARNAGIVEARGIFVQLLDSDDMLVPGKIDVQVAHFLIQPRLDVSITNYLTCDEEAQQFQRDGDSIGPFNFGLDDFLFRWERGLSIPIHCGLFRRDVFDRIAFDTLVAGKEDWIFWSQLAHEGRNIGYLPVNGAIYRQHPSGMSKSYRVMGDNLRIAAERIQELTGNADPRFISEIQSWYHKFYQPRILEEDGGARPPPNFMQKFSLPEKPDGINEPSIGEPVQRASLVSHSPVLSVIVPVHDHYQHLSLCLASIASQQDAADVEIVLIDDCSADTRVRPMLQAFARDMPSVRLLLQDKNLGISTAQNVAVANACGKYVAFLDCDDVLEPNALADAKVALGPDVDYLFTDRIDIDENGNKIRVARYGGYDWLTPSGDVRRDLLDGMVASHLKIINREIYTRLGGCSPQYSGIQDWELALRIADAGGKFLYVPKPLYRHRVHSKSVTWSQSPRQFWLSNSIRRGFSKRWLGRAISDDVALSRAAAAHRAIRTGQPPTDIFCVTEFRAPETLTQLKRAWQSGSLCVYAPPPEAPLLDLRLAREYNSYFDGVFASDEAVACFFVGFMWDHAALHFADDRQ